MTMPLWGYMIQVEHQYQIWQWLDIKDIPFLWSMDMGMYNWEEPDTELHQATWAMRYSATPASQMFLWILQNEEKVGGLRS